MLNNQPHLHGGEKKTKAALNVKNWVKAWFAESRVVRNRQEIRSSYDKKKKTIKTATESVGLVDTWLIAGDGLQVC